MASKVAPAISSPGSSKFSNKGAHNPNVGTRGSGLAPKPKATAPDRPASASVQAGMARVKPAGTGANQGAMPLRKPPAGLKNQRVGQAEKVARGAGSSLSALTQTPRTGNPVATAKPASRKTKGASFYGEY